MAEFFTGRDHSLNLTRKQLKQFRQPGHPLYPWDSTRAFDVPSLEDDFWGPTLSTFLWTVGNGGGASAASPVVSVGKVNGQITMVTGTAGDNTASSILVGGRHFQGDHNAVITVCLAAPAAVTSLKVEIGFKDNILTTAGNGAVINSKSGSTAIATDGVAWIYDSADTGRGWDGMGVAAGVVAARMTSYNVVPVVSTFEYLQIALLDGVAFFSHYTAAGVQDFPPTQLAAAVTKTVLLAPYVYIEAKNGTSKTNFVDMIRCSQGRTTD